MAGSRHTAQRWSSAMWAENGREHVLRSEGEEVPHRGHAGCHHERIKRRTDKARRAHGKRMVAAELRTADQPSAGTSRRP
jgi:hypothetical protein